MERTRLDQSRRWRAVLLVALCAVVYYVSFDHGRESLRPRLSELDRLKEENRGELDRLRAELARLKAQLAACPAAQADPSQTEGRIALRVNQSRTLFNDRLVLSVQDIDHQAGRVLIQLNFVRENHQMSKELTVGDSFGFRLGGRDWAVVLARLTPSTAILNLMEIKSGL